MIVGIDPGIDGAAALFDTERGFVDVIDLPTYTSVRDRREFDDVNFLRWLKLSEPVRIVMESVHSLPQEGVASAFRFGVTVGRIQAACRAYLGLHSLEMVEPTVWKDYYDLIGTDKDASRQLAIELWPSPAYSVLARKKDHNRAEAMLIAAWGARPPVGKDWSRGASRSQLASPLVTTEQDDDGD